MFFFFQKVNTDNLSSVMNSLNRSNISNSSEDENMYDLSIDNQITECQILKAKSINEKALELKYDIHLFEIINLEIKKN